MADVTKRNTWHKDLTDELIFATAERRATSLDDPGFCLACGLECDGVEPDAEKYLCESCGQLAVYGAEQLLIYIA